MKRILICLLTIILALSLVLPVAGAQPDFGKILQIHLTYHNNGYSVSSLDVSYGTAPNLNIQSGPLKGTILDSKGNELKSFSLQPPGFAFGDSVGPDGQSLVGSTGQSGAGNMYSGSMNYNDLYITVPYLQDMQKFSLTDEHGSVLASVDLNPAVTGFCTDYPQDPDCLARTPVSPTATPGLSVTLVLAILLSVMIFVAAAWIIRRRAVTSQPEQEVALIVDDDPLLVTLMETLLFRKGYGTLKASGGKEALDILKDHTPDMILLDVVMEPMDGWQTLEHIKKNPATRSIPVLMITGKKLTVTEAKQYNLHIDDYIMKPFQPSDLYAAVDRIRDQKRKLDETLLLAKKAGVDEEMCYECSRLSLRISTNKKILDILNVPRVIPATVDLDTLDDMLVVDYINVRNSLNEKRVEQLHNEINSAFRSKGLPDFDW